ncbi:MAG: hydantoin racemase [Lawsonibacter sp.]|nr:hydantoin racemase [Lawsonibacter sp.]
MRRYRVGLIRVLTTEDPELLGLHGKLLEQYFPMLEVEFRCIPHQPEGIHDDATMALSAPKVVALAREMWQEGFEAIVVSCAGDPGVEQARREVPIPVVGAGESTAALSLFYGSRPAVLGITADVPAGFQRTLGPALVSSDRGDGVESVLDLMTAQGCAATSEAAKRQKAMGADVIALSCTGMSTIRIAPELERELGIPVLDPVMCEGLMVLFELLRRHV